MAHRAEGLSDIFEHDVLVRGTLTAKNLVGDGAGITNLTLNSSVDLYGSDPGTPFEGQLIINTSTHIMKVYYEGEWRELHTFVVTEYFLLQETGDKILQETGDGVYQE